jgi:hypothetical protein
MTAKTTGGALRRLELPPTHALEISLISLDIHITCGVPSLTAIIEGEK